MKEALHALLETTFDTLIAQGVIPADAPRRIQVDRTKDKSHGDFATNLAMTLAKAAGKKPRDLAQLIVDHLPENDAITQVDIAGPGFINFFMNDSARFAVVEQALTNTKAFCSPDLGKGEKVLLEYVSANPTGPMHVGHGRGAAYGSALGNLLKATGYAVHHEYYINDAGRQADVLAVSVYLRYLEACGETVAIPSRAYPSAYVQECATALFDSVGKYVDARLVHMRHRVSKSGIGMIFSRAPKERAPLVEVVRMVGSAATVTLLVVSCPDNAL